MPFGYGGGGGGFRGDPRAHGGFGNDGADFGDIFEGLFGGRGGGGPFGGFGGRSAPPQKGANVAYRLRSEEHTSELQSLMRISYAVFCLKKKNKPENLQLFDNAI